MPHIDAELLAPIVDRFVDRVHLTPSEQAEVARIARGFACKDSAAAAFVSPETIRARRKRIYRKLRVPGSVELISALLALALEMLSSGKPPGELWAERPGGGEGLPKSSAALG